MATAALPPGDLIFLIIPAYSGLFYLWWQSETKWQAFFTGWWFGLAYFASGLYWFAYALLVEPDKFAWMIPFAVLGLPSVLAIYYGLACVLARMLRNRLPLSGLLQMVMFAVIWTGVEVLRGYLFTGFPWNLAAYSWSFSEAMVQPVALAGSYLYSGWTVLLALLFKKVPPFDAFYEKAEAGRYLGVCFLITTLFLIVSDRLRIPRERQRRLREMKLTDALIIGGMQGVGVLSGVSRSGSTISGALFAGLDRRAAADFSFLLSIPSILGGAVLEIPDALEQGIAGIHWTAVFAGMMVAGLTGYFAIRFMLRAIKKKRLLGFGIYTGALGLLVLVDQFITHIFF